jgi:hypothetical protein
MNIDLTKAKLPIAKGVTIPDGLTDLDLFYIDALVNLHPLYEDVYQRDEFRIDRIEPAPTSLMYWGDEPDATPGILVYMSRFIQVGGWQDVRYLQIMTVHHIYSENGWTPDDHDPYDVWVGDIEYREVRLSDTGIWRTALNDPTGKDHDVDLHLDWLDEL